MFNFETVIFKLSIIVFFSITSSFFFTGAIWLAARHWTWQTLEIERSLHKGSILVGGGIALIAVTLLTWFCYIQTFDSLIIFLLISVLLLATVSWIDDIGNVPIIIRFLIQICVVALCLYIMPSSDRVFSSNWPLVIDRLFTGICWIWFINLFNFMDGIDGLAASESVTISFGILLIGIIVGVPVVWLFAAAALFGSSLGFLPWNWHPSKIILGDVGAIPMGFLLGFLLIQLAVHQLLLAAIILPLYFILDATITIFKRLAHGKNIVHAHREHFYQKAVLAGTKPSHVVLFISATNIFLIGTAKLSVNMPVIGGILAVVAVLLLLFYLHTLSRG